MVRCTRIPLGDVYATLFGHPAALSELVTIMERRLALETAAGVAAIARDTRHRVDLAARRAVEGRQGRPA